MIDNTIQFQSLSSSRTRSEPLPPLVLYNEAMVSPWENWYQDTERCNYYLDNTNPVFTGEYQNRNFYYLFMK